MFIKRKAMIGMAIVLSVLVTGCGYVRPQPDTIAVHYSGGPFSSHKFVSCVQPSGSKWIGVGDAAYYYPVGQRTASFVSNSKDKDFDPIANVVSKDNVSMTIEGIATFDFTRDCSLIRKFHETIGNKYQAYTNDGIEGWNKMLDSYMRQPLVRAITISTSKYNYADLYNNGAQYAAWVADVESQMPDLLKAQAGDDYFTNFHLTLQKPDLPQGIVDALNSQQQASAQNAAQAQLNQKVNTELDSIRALVSVLGVQGYLVYEGEKNGQVQVIPVPQGTSVQVNSNK